MAAGVKLSHAEASARFSAAGYDLRSAYRNQVTKVVAYCPKHNEEHEVLPTNIFKGQHLKCCWKDSIRNARTGAVMSDATKAKLSEYRGEKHAGYGKRLPKETREKVRESISRLHRTSVDYAILRAANGKTSGKPGYFYIAKTGNGLLKFGSVHKLTPARRMYMLREETGFSSLQLLVQVSDAGAYEAAMMERHREHWSHGEYFKDFRSELNCAA